MCVILTLAIYFPTKSVQTAPLLPGRGNQRCNDAAVEGVGNQMEKESTPLWVWLSVALMAIGAVTYVTTVYFVEHIMAFF